MIFISFYDKVSIFRNNSNQSETGISDKKLLAELHGNLKLFSSIHSEQIFITMQMFGGNYF